MPSGRPRGSTTVTAPPAFDCGRSTTSLAKIQGWPAATRSEALRLTLISVIALALLAHGLQARDAIFGRRVRREHTHDGIAGEWLNDEHVRGGGSGLHRNTLRPPIELLQSVDERIRRTYIFGRCGVRVILARTRDGHLDDHGRDGREDQHEDGADAAAAAVVVALASAKPEKERHAGEERDGGRNHGCDRTDQDVTMQHVAEFVRHNAFN